jgi:hypothetical protein
MSVSQLLDPITNKITSQYVPDGLGIVSQQFYSTELAVYDPPSHSIILGGSPALLPSWGLNPPISKSGNYGYSINVLVNGVSSWFNSRGFQFYATKNGSGPNGPIVPGSYQTISDGDEGGIYRCVLNGLMYLNAGDTLDWYWFVDANALELQYTDTSFSLIYYYTGNKDLATF